MNSENQNRSFGETSANGGGGSGSIVRVLMLVVVVALVGWLIWRQQPPQAQNDPLPAEQENRVADLLNERRQLDETIWKDEVEAQRYEEYFVNLWDEMRAADDQIAVLAAAPFQEIQLKEPGTTRQTDWGIQMVQCDGSLIQLNQKQFAQRATELATSGLKIIHTEWHHSRFEVEDQGGMRSTVAIRVDAVHEVTNVRYMITGDIVVNWAPATDPAVMPVPESIDATGLRLTERQGDAPFSIAKKISARAGDIPLSIPSIIASDLDQDGLSDLLIPSANALYRNQGNWEFEPEQLFSHPPAEQITSSVAADFNGDARLDLFCALPGSPVLYLADAQGAFSTPPQVISCLAEPLTLPSAVTAGDIDADGDVDVWLTQYKPAYHYGQMPTPYYDANDGFPSSLLINDGRANFQDQTEQRGLAPKRTRRTYSASFVDLDADNDLDLAVANDYAGLDLYLNDGAGMFRDISDTLGDQRHCFGMSLTFADYNHDQQLDLYMTGMASTTARRLERLGVGREEFPEHQTMRPLMGYGNRMFLRQGNGFVQAPFNDQVARTGWSWGSTSFDFDNDADADLYIANGHRSTDTAKDYCTRFWTHDIYTANSQDSPQMIDFFEEIHATELAPVSWNGFEHNCLLMNLGGQEFIKIGFLAGVGFEFDSRNVIGDDFVADGRRDLLVVGKLPHERDGSIYLLRNDWPTDNHWIGVRLQESQGRSPLGAIVQVRTESGTQLAPIVAGDSLYSQHAPTAHFGLGTTDKVDSITVRWSNGTESTIEQPQVDRYHVVE